jgi:hypothetical protein
LLLREPTRRTLCYFMNSLLLQEESNFDRTCCIEERLGISGLGLRGRRRGRRQPWAVVEAAVLWIWVSGGGLRVLGFLWLGMITGHEEEEVETSEDRQWWRAAAGGGEAAR